MRYAILVLDRNEVRARRLASSINRAIAGDGELASLIVASGFTEVKVSHAAAVPSHEETCHFALLHSNNYRVFQDYVKSCEKRDLLRCCQFSGGGAIEGERFWIQKEVRDDLVDFDHWREDWRELVHWAVQNHGKRDVPPRYPRILCATHEATVSDDKVVLTRCVVLSWVCNGKDRVERLVRSGDLPKLITELECLMQFAEGAQDDKLSRAIAKLHHEATSHVLAQGESHATALRECATTLEELARQRLSSNQPIEHGGRS